MEVMAKAESNAANSHIVGYYFNILAALNIDLTHVKVFEIS